MQHTPVRVGVKKEKKDIEEERHRRRKDREDECQEQRREERCREKRREREDEKLEYMMKTIPHDNIS